MAIVVKIDQSSFLVLRYVEQKSNGSFQYRRRIPKNVQHAHQGKAFFVRNLKRDSSRIQVLSGRLTERLDQEWSRLGNALKTCSDKNVAYPITNGDPGSIFSDELISDADLSRVKTCSAASLDNSALTLSEALSLYLRLHRSGTEEKFIADNTRTVTALTDALGDLPLNAYTRLDAEIYRDGLLKRKASGTVRRRLRMVCAIFNRATKEKQLAIYPFQNLGLAREGDDEERRIPFTKQELGILSTACRKLDDDIRHIIAMQMDTGARVGEIIGLRIDDVIFDHSHPHLRIRPFGKVRTLKTRASERDIPLIGDAHWAARRAVEARTMANDGSPWLFPRYASDKEIKATHASNTLNKWLRSLDGVDCNKTTHCFRHAMRDRLRAPQVPSEIQDVIGGWGSRSVGQKYGLGYPVKTIYEHMSRLTGM